MESRNVSNALLRAARILACVLFTAAGAQLAVRLPGTPVPVTVQTLFVVLAGITLGPRDGFYAMLAYLLLGASGAPVFAGFAFGPVHLVGPTAGYLIAFPAAAAVAGSLHAVLGGTRIAAFTGALTGSTLILASGALYLSLLFGVSLAQAAVIGIAPFALAELVKAGIAAGLTR
jgi:biotin transport system substrate-specific component